MANNIKILTVVSGKSYQRDLDFVGKFLPTDMLGQPSDYEKIYIYTK